MYNNRGFKNQTKNNKMADQIRWIITFYVNGLKIPFRNRDYWGGYFTKQALTIVSLEKKYLRSNDTDR